MLALERAWKAHGLQPLANRQTDFEEFFAKVVSKLQLMRNFHRSGNGPILVALMGYSESRLLPLCFANEFIPFCFDCWSPTYERWEAFFRRHRIRIAMFSARASASHFARLIPEMRSLWIPEAVDIAEYLSGPPLAERDIDVLELGRRFDRYHDAITASLRQQGRVHLFEQVRGTVIFPTKQELLDGLSRAKVSVCFPSSITHPERSGNVETVTLRYFESMASRCVLVGRCPTELADLFGYNPVVEVKCGGEVEQLLEIVAAPDRYQHLVDRNRRRLLEVGTWDARVEEMLRVFNVGYESQDCQKAVSVLHE